MVEMLVALVLITVVLSGTLAMQVAVMQGNRKAQQTSVAVTLAQRHVENFHTTHYDALTASVSWTCYSFNLAIVGTVNPCVDTHADGPWAYRVSETVVGSLAGGFQLSVEVEERTPEMSNLTGLPAAYEHLSAYSSERNP